MGCLADIARDQIVEALAPYDLARVAVANFQNEGGLTQIGSSQFQASANSGLALLGTAGTGTIGGCWTSQQVNPATCP